MITSTPMDSHFDNQQYIPLAGWNGTCPWKPPESVSDLIHDEPDFYDVSLTDGFNLPIAIEAINGSMVIVAVLVVKMIWGIVVHQS